MAIFTVKKGSRTIIEVAKTQNAATKSVVQPKGIIRSRREPEYLARRKKTSGGIRFIDLGQIKLGDIFTSIAAMLVPDVTVFSDIQIATFNVTMQIKKISSARSRRKFSQNSATIIYRSFTK